MAEQRYMENVTKRSARALLRYYNARDPDWQYGFRLYPGTSKRHSVGYIFRYRLREDRPN